MELSDEVRDILFISVVEVAGWPDRELSLGDIDAPSEGWVRLSSLLGYRALRGLFGLSSSSLLLLLGALVIVVGQ